MTYYYDKSFAARKTKTFILELMDEGYSPQDIIEGIEQEVSRFEELVFDYE